MNAPFLFITRKLGKTILYFTLLLACTIVYCKEAPPVLYLEWDTEVGCQVYSNPDRKLLLEEIGDSECVRVCKGSEVKYSIKGDVNAVNFIEWEVVGGFYSFTDVTSTLGITVQWDSETTDGLIFMTIYMQDGSVIEKVQCFEKIRIPKADFLVLPNYQTRRFCIGQTVYFENLSNENDPGHTNTTYLWDFGDGNFSSTFEPSHVYNTVGNYVVVLMVINECGCKDYFRQSIRVGELGVKIECASMVCENQKDKYKTSPGCNSVSWSVDGGTIVGPTIGEQVEIVWDDVDEYGFGYVYANVETCGFDCRQTGMIKVPVITSKGKIQGESNVCENKFYTYSLPQWPTTEFNWTLEDPMGIGGELIISDQRNEVILKTNVETFGDLVLKCTYKNTFLKCGGFAELRIKVNTNNIIIGAKELCIGATESFALENNQFPVIDFDWLLKTPSNQEITLQDVNLFTYTFNEVGIYILKAMSDNYCNIPHHIIKVQAIPDTPLGTVEGPTDVCVNFPYVFFKENIVEGTDFVWEVTGGTIQGVNRGNEVTIIFDGTETSPQIKIYRVSKERPFCKSSPLIVTRTLFVPNFSITGQNEVCENSIIGGYAVNYGLADYYEWSIEPAGMGSVTQNENSFENISVTWNKFATNEPVILKLVIGKCGQEYLVTYPITIIRNGTATVVTTPTQVCKDEPFTASAVVNNPTLTSFSSIEWIFSGPNNTTTSYNTQSLTSPQHFFTQPIEANQNFIVRVVINNPNGCPSPLQASTTITYLGAPKPDVFTEQVVYCDPNPVFAPLTILAPQGYTFASIQWYLNSTLISGATGNTYTPLTIGVYSAIVTYVDFPCEVKSDFVNLTDDCDDITLCSINPTLTMTAINNACLTYSANGNAPATFGGWTLQETGWLCLPAFGIAISPATGNSTTITSTNVGSFILRYAAKYKNDITQEECSKFIEQTIIFPYKPNLKVGQTCIVGTNNYSIDLISQSQQFASTPIEKFEFKIDNGPWIDNGSASVYSTILAGGATYIVGLRISRTGYAACEVFLELALPQVPVATFTLSPTTCQNTKISLVPDYISTTADYIWDFGDGSSLTFQTAEKVYYEPDPYTISLTIIENGCTVSQSQSIIVKENKLQGSILPTNAKECQGTPIMLLYDSNIGANIPTEYHWYYNNLLQTIENTGSFTASQSGSYRVVVFDNDDCKTNIPAVPVTFIRTPTNTINGNTVLCEGMPLVLESDLKDPLYPLKWYLNGVLQSEYNNATTFVVAAIATGNYEVELHTGVSDGNGGFCYDVQAVMVEVQPPLEPLELTLGLRCNWYRGVLIVENPGLGNYVWSNGANGSIIEILYGGAYEVTYTNLAGCSITGSITVPKFPEEYLWIFPTGCYEWCKEDTEGYLIGPYAAFDAWNWLTDSSPSLSGINVPSSFILPIEEAPTTLMHQLSLYDGRCERTSGPMNITHFNCISCESIVFGGAVALPVIHEDGSCYFSIKISLENTTSGSVQLQINELFDQGLIIGSHHQLAPGLNTITVLYYPNNMPPSNPIELYMQFTLPNGELCTLIKEVVLPLCQLGENREKGINTSEEKTITIVPNPTDGVLTIHHNIVGQNTTLYLYDMTGRLVAQINKTLVGKDIFVLPSLTEGMYLLSLLDNTGKVIHQQKISKK